MFSWWRLFFFIKVVGDQRGGSLENWENKKNRISLTILSQLFLNYALMLDILILHLVHMEFSDGTLPILLNF